MARFLAKRLMIRLIIYWYIFWLSFPAMTMLNQFLVAKYVIPEGYISTIHTPYYSNAWTQQVLEEFNAMGDGKAVLFDQHVIDRPITIREKDDLEMVPKFLRDPEEELVTIGLAERGAYYCRITLKTGLDYATFRATLIHEYLHCMGYDHVENAPNDLMAPVDGEVSEENIRMYAKRVAKKIWKNLKN